MSALSASFVAPAQRVRVAPRRVVQARGCVRPRHRVRRVHPLFIPYRWPGRARCAPRASRVLCAQPSTTPVVVLGYAVSVGRARCASCAAPGARCGVVFLSPAPLLTRFPLTSSSAARAWWCAPTAASSARPPTLCAPSACGRNPILARCCTTLRCPRWSPPHARVASGRCTALRRLRWSPPHARVARVGCSPPPRACPCRLGGGGQQLPSLCCDADPLRPPQIMVASTGLILAAGRFGLAPSANRLASAGLKLTEKKQGQLSGDPAGFTASDVLYGGSVGHSACPAHATARARAHPTLLPLRPTRLTRERCVQSSALASCWACAASARCRCATRQLGVERAACNEE